MASTLGLMKDFSYAGFLFPSSSKWTKSSLILTFQLLIGSIWWACQYSLLYLDFLLELGSQPKLECLLKLLLLYTLARPKKVVMFSLEALTLGLLETSGCQWSLSAGQCCCVMYPTVWNLENLESHNLTHLSVLLCSGFFDRVLTFLLWSLRSSC